MAEETKDQTVAEGPEQSAQPAAANHGTKPTMAIKVYAPFKVYFEGEGYSISAVNATGPFDILPRHHNFLCMLVPCTLMIETLEGQKTVKVSRALMHVKADRVTVFMNV